MLKTLFKNKKINNICRLDELVFHLEMHPKICVNHQMLFGIQIIHDAYFFMMIGGNTCEQQ